MHWLFCVCSIRYYTLYFVCLQPSFFTFFILIQLAFLKYFPLFAHHNIVPASSCLLEWIFSVSFIPQFCFISLNSSMLPFLRSVFFFSFLEQGRRFFVSFNSSTTVFPFLDFIFSSSLHLSFPYTPPAWHGRSGYTIGGDPGKHVFSCYKCQIEQWQKTAGSCSTDKIFRKSLIIKWQVPVFSFFGVCFYLYPSSSKAVQYQFNITATK